MKKNTGFNNNRTFGVEIEFFLGCSSRPGAFAEEVAQVVKEYGIECHAESYNHVTRPHWKIVTDGSVSYEGLEIVSPPLRGQEGLSQIKKVLEALNKVKAKVDDSCGLHIHHDVRDFTLKKFKYLYGLYARFEDCIDELVPMSRRGNTNTYCLSPGTDLEKLQKARSIDELIYNLYPSRYIKLNCQSFRRQGTVEFRHPGGTLEYQEVMSWVVLTQMMIEKAANGVVQLRKGASDWFNFKKIIRAYAWMGADKLQQEAVSYMNKKRRQLAKKYNQTLAS